MAHSQYVVQRVQMSINGKTHVVHTYNGNFSLAIKWNEVLIYAATWMNFQNIFLNEESQTQKFIYHTIQVTLYQELIKP